MNITEVLLLKYGEVVLKGLNRSKFENQMISDAAARMKKCGDFAITRSQSIMYITPKDEFAYANIDKAFNQALKVFGIVSVSRALRTEKNMDVIKEEIITYTKDALLSARTFKVEAKRSDKAFMYGSPEISKICGGILLKNNPHLKVDVNNPDVTIKVEIRDEYAYIHCKAYKGAGGMPKGTAGKGVLLLSGGIDSPVAGYVMSKRGVSLEALHFESFPYTSDRALQKVVDLANIMSDSCGAFPLTSVNVAHIQEEIKNKCREEYFTLLLRRFMMRIAEKIAIHYNSRCIITGESLGQVASQTLGALGVTNDAVKALPVFRPLIAMDKEEIVTIARKIDTFETSIEPFEDCCTVFTPRHPVTNPKLENILEEEAKLDIDFLVNEAYEQRKVLIH